MNLIYLQRPNIPDQCTTLPISLYTFNVTITCKNDTEGTINGSISDPMNGPGIFNMSFKDIFNEELMPDTTYCFHVSAQNEQNGNNDGKYLCSYVILNGYDCITFTVDACNTGGKPH